MVIKKGDLVSFRKIEPQHRGPENRITAWRRITDSERVEWYKSDDALGMTDDGLTKLAPKDVWFYLNPDQMYLVKKARVRAPCGYGHRSGCLEVVDLFTGEQIFVERIFLKV